MASLQELLAEEGFQGGKTPKNRKPVKSRERITSDDSIALPTYICHDRKNFDSSKQTPQKSLVRNASSVSSSKRVDSNSKRSNSKSSCMAEALPPQSGETIVDEVAVRAVVSILGGYIGRFIKDESFRERVREKCYSCMEGRSKDGDNAILANMELGIESIERLAENHGTKKELKMKSLRNSIRLLSIVASLNSHNSKNDTTCGIPNSHLSACAQLYLSIVYKLEKNDRISARHLLQVFCDSPFLARTHLLPDLWEHFFLPHFLHLKIWYSKEEELILNWESGEKERKMKALIKVYNEKMDMGTSQFALYYKEWLKVGAKAPPMPSVSLPSRPSYGAAKRRGTSLGSQASLNKSLYRAVFGRINERQSLELENDTWSLEEEVKVCNDEHNIHRTRSVHSSGKGVHRRSISQQSRNPKAELWPETRKSDYFRFFPCRSEPAKNLVQGAHVSKNDSIRKESPSYLPSNSFGAAIKTICTSQSLSDCELAIRVVAKAWLDSHADPVIETMLSKAPVLEGMLEVLFTSEDEETLELAISILAELVSRGEVNRQIILNSDPQLEVLMRLLRSNSLFLKASVLLYLLKPKAKQMLSIEWIPLVLRVVEFGDELQTLFSVQCSPQVAAFYLLDQLLTGFNEDGNLENARQVVALGGLSLLVRSLETGDPQSRSAASIITSCIQADGSCRNYLANNINKASILQLLILGNRSRSSGSILSLLIELLCLNRRTEITSFLNGLKNNEERLNTMHILLVYLQWAPPEQRSLVAAILLQLDLLEDSFQYSVYREEAVDAIITALDCKTCNEKVQQQSARSLLLLGGRFSYMGEASTETWLLKQAGFDDSTDDSFHGKEIVYDEILIQNEEEESIQNWLRKAATVLLTSGKNRFLVALSECMANGIPYLARASLITVAWLSRSLTSIQDSSLQSTACSILVPRLIETLNYDRALEERVLASLSLLCLIKNSECISMISPLSNEMMGPLRNLALVTWTAEELLSIATSQTCGIPS
ncbi:PREDICTED: putative E3 ubiquitin-protein ligase LIN [Nelumbo nucifera]|uniref:E3 ubiquitin-protein ligase LIN n=2 Tax=Nelumbo nucifera TaxID=4432 RepID=A0A1U8AZU9_NELNU|nr:PREDICTED: putative E3 ubiquitin-protein ligase LIN [Nelumbo nucifera]DAD43817.1 TPA_asm: hypothetical protein HUJ06_002047 [Nelumbo nucifera]